MGHGLDRDGTFFQAPLHNQDQENTSPLLFGSERNTEDAWLRLRTHIKKKYFKKENHHKKGCPQVGSNWV